MLSLYFNARKHNSTVHFQIYASTQDTRYAYTTYSATLVYRPKDAYPLQDAYQLRLPAVASFSETRDSLWQAGQGVVSADGIKARRG